MRHMMRGTLYVMHMPYICIAKNSNRTLFSISCVFLHWSPLCVFTQKCHWYV